MKKSKIRYSKFKSWKSFLKGSKTFNKYHIELIFAQIGSGKSTDIAKKCYRLIKKGTYKYVYTNIDINIPEVRTFDVADFNAGKFIFPEDSIILIDEVSLLYDNRSFKSFPKPVGNYLRLSRHYKNTFIFYSQHYDCDKVIRTLASRLRYMFKVGHFSITRSVKKVIEVQSTQDSKGGADSQIVDTLKFESVFTRGSIQVTYIPFYVKLFDSYSKSSDYHEEIPFTSSSLSPSPNAD